MSCLQLWYLRFYSHFRKTLLIQSHLFSSNSDNNDFTSFSNEDEIKGSPTQEDKQATAKKKLADLLISLSNVTESQNKTISKIDIVHPERKFKRVIDDSSSSSDDSSSDSDSDDDNDVAKIVSEVAEEIGGDMKQTKSELLTALRSHTDYDITRKEHLRELFTGMGVEKDQKLERATVPMHKRERHYGSMQDFSDAKFRRVPEDTKLFKEKPLNIFSGVREAVSYLSVWDKLQAKELELAVSHPPQNAIQEMIQWTKQGKLWTFPIDNEIGLKEEKSIGFHEHIFLEQHLKDWCPEKGPIRHFMELVCTGLSKNPFLTVDRKRAHINWYKEYFEQKWSILKETGAVN